MINIFTQNKFINISMRLYYFDLPKLLLNTDIKDIDSFIMDDIYLENYKPQAAIKAEMAV